MGSEVVRVGALPVIRCNPDTMPLPNIWSLASLKDKYYRSLLDDIRHAKVPLVFAVMNGGSPGSFPKSSKELYRVGVVAIPTGGGNTETEIVLEGTYRAEVSRFENDSSGHWTAHIRKRIMDVAEVEFVEEDHGYMILDPQYQISVAGLFVNIKRRISGLIKEALPFTASDVGPLEQIYDEFDAYDLNRRDVVDQLIWKITDALLNISPSDKQRIIEKKYLMQRALFVLMLADKNIRILEDAGCFNSIPKLRIKSDERTGSGTTLSDSVVLGKGPSNIPITPRDAHTIFDEITSKNSILH